MTDARHHEAAPSPSPMVEGAASFVLSWRFFAASLVALVLVQVLPLETLLGDGGAGLIRRNSESFIMVLTPWFWLRYAMAPGHGSGSGARGRDVRTSAWVWVVAWTLAGVVLQGISLGWVDLSLDQRVVTLGEGCLVVGLVSLFLGATRHVLDRGPALPIEGWSARPAAVVARLVVVLALLVAAASYSAAGARLLGPGVVDYVRLNVEAVAGLLLLVLAVDVVVPGWVAGRRAVVVGWYGLLAGIVVISQLGVLGDVLPKTMDWVSRATEAFLAAAVVTAWFLVHVWDRDRHLAD